MSDTNCSLSFKIKEIALPVQTDKIGNINNIEQVVNSLNLTNLVVSYEAVTVPVTIPSPCTNSNLTINSTASLLKIRLLGMVNYSVLIFEVATSALAGKETTDFIDLTAGYIASNNNLDPSKYTAKLILDPFKVDTSTSPNNVIFLINGTLSLTYNTNQ